MDEELKRRIAQDQSDILSLLTRVIVFIVGIVVFAMIMGTLSSCNNTRNQKWKRPVKTNVGYMDVDLATVDSRVVIVSSDTAKVDSFVVSSKICEQIFSKDCNACHGPGGFKDILGR